MRMTEVDISNDIITCIETITEYLTNEEKHSFYEEPSTKHIYIQALTVHAWLNTIEINGDTGENGSG